MVNTVVINNKAYRVPEFTFGIIRRLENNGFPVFDMRNMQKEPFTTIHAFVAVVCDVDSDEADRLIQQHILGGGNFDDIMKAISSAIETSDFFTQMAKNQKKEAKTRQKSQSTTEATEN